MHYRMTAIRVLFVEAAILALAPPLHAEPPEPVALIEQLASPNPPPLVYGEGRRRPGYETPEGFDAEKQEQVYKARAKLKELGPTAFPFLIERWGDQRYSLTIESVQGCCHNQTVGNVCHSIIYDQLQPYGTLPKIKGRGEPFGHPARPDYPKVFLASAEDAKAWWEKHKDLSLHAMQLMVIEWVQAEETKRPKDFMDEERVYLEKLRNDLLTSGEAIKRGGYAATERFRMRSSKPTGRPGK